MTHRIKDARLGAGYSDAQAARLLPRIWLAETLEQVPDDVLIRAAWEFGVSVCWISGHIGQIPGIAHREMIVVTASAGDGSVDGVTSLATVTGSCPSCLAGN